MFLKLYVVVGFIYGFLVFSQSMERTELELKEEPGVGLTVILWLLSLVIASLWPLGLAYDIYINMGEEK